MNPDQASEWLLQKMQAFIERLTQFENSLQSIVEDAEQHTRPLQAQMRRVQAEFEAFARHMGGHMEEVIAYRMALPVESQAGMPGNFLTSVLTAWDGVFATWAEQGGVKYQKGELFNIFVNEFNSAHAQAVVPPVAAMLEKDMKLAETAIIENVESLRRTLG